MCATGLILFHEVLIVGRTIDDDNAYEMAQFGKGQMESISQFSGNGIPIMTHQMRGFKT